MADYRSGEARASGAAAAEAPADWSPRDQDYKAGALTAALLLAFLFPFIRFDVRPFVVTGASMSPALPMGALALVDPVAPSTLVVGDVVTYALRGSTVTHRVAAIEERANTRAFSMRGDRNPVADTEWLELGDRVGLVRGHVPFVGYLVGYAQAYWRAVLMLVSAFVFVACAALLLLSAGSGSRSVPFPSSHPS